MKHDRTIAMALRLAACVVTLSSCGGGGGGGTIPAANPSSKPSGGPTSATFTISNGTNATLQNISRKPAYVGPGTASIQISVNNQPTLAFPCNVGVATYNCTFTFNVPSGNDTFTVVDADAFGNALSRATFTQDCAANANTIIKAVLNGIVTSTDGALAKAYAPMGTTSSTKVVVTARDTDGAVIVGPGNYLHPIQLSDSDTTGASSLSETSVASPSDVVTLNYDGQGYVNPTITAFPASAQLNPQPARLTPLLNAVELPVPSGSMTSTGMALGSDGALWFSEARGIGRVATTGSITEYGVPDLGPGEVVLGGDGNMWFAGSANNDPANPHPADIGSITPSGAITIFNLYKAADSTTSYPLNGVTRGPDGNIWFAYDNYELGTISNAGNVTSYAPTFGASLSVRAADLTTGPDGNLWLVDPIGTLDRYSPGSLSVTAYQTPPMFPGAASGSMQPARLVVGRRTFLHQQRRRGRGDGHERQYGNNVSVLTSSWGRGQAGERVQRGLGAIVGKRRRPPNDRPYLDVWKVMRSSHSPRRPR